jgi:hypothetical protein
VDSRPYEPRTFRDIVEADLRRAARLLIKVQDEIDPQFRVATPEGDYWLAVTLPVEVSERTAMLHRIGTFFAWKQATAFTLATELVDPDCVYCVGIAGRERYACLARIQRHPKPWTAASFGPTEWLPDASINPVIASLLPGGPRPMTPKEVAAAEQWFGTGGRLPAVHIATGEVRGLG